MAPDAGVRCSAHDVQHAGRAVCCSARCIANRDHGDQAWRFVREHWDHANAALPATSIVRMVDPVKTLTRPEQQADVAGFFAEHAIPQAAKTLQQVLERQRVNVALRDREAPRARRRTSE